MISLWWVVPLGVATFLLLVSVRLRRDDGDAARLASGMGLFAGLLAGGRIVSTDSGAFYPFLTASVIAFCFAGFLAWRYMRGTRK